jgi:hypothetical protein
MFFSCCCRRHDDPQPERQIKKSAFAATVYGGNFGGANILAGLTQQNDPLITGVIFCRRNTQRRSVEVSPPGEPTQ